MLQQIVFLTGLLVSGAVLAAAEAAPPAVLMLAAETAPATEPIPAPEPMPAAEAAPAAKAVPAPEPMPVPVPGDVARAQFTTTVVDREPVDKLSRVASDIGTVYFFSDLRDFAGQTVVHRWLHNGKVMAEVSFHVGGPRWRVWSSKNLAANWTGKWTVEVVAADGSVVMTRSLMVTTPVAHPAAATMPAEQSPPAPESPTQD